MTTPRTPVVLGSGRGTGASTVAAALHAHDGGPWDTAADVIVCAAREDSLLRAERLAVAATRPWLAVVLLRPGPTPARERLATAARRCAGFTVLPWVEQWAGRPTCLDDLRALLGHEPGHLPPALRGYAAGLRTIAAALVHSGQLDHPLPPVVAQPRPDGWPGCAAPTPFAAAAVWRPMMPLRPMAFHGRPLSADPTRGHRDDDPDDEALELAVDLLVGR